MTMTLFRKHFLMEENNSQRPYRPKIAGIVFVCNDPAQFASTTPARSIHCRSRLPGTVAPQCGQNVDYNVGGATVWKIVHNNMGAGLRAVRQTETTDTGPIEGRRGPQITSLDGASELSMNVSSW